MITELACVCYLIDKYNEKYNKYFKKYLKAITSSQSDEAIKYYQQQCIKIEIYINELIRRKEALENKILTKED